jgi:hypothetical protein
LARRRRRNRDVPPVVFFLDENTLGAHVAERLRAAGAEVRELGTDIPRGTPDEEMLVEVGQRGWFLITRDFQLRRRPAEAEARRRAGLGVFILRGPRLTREEIAGAVGRRSANADSHTPLHTPGAHDRAREGTGRAP